MLKGNWEKFSNKVKTNKMNILNATIGVLAAATAVTMIFSPALFGLLSAGTLAALGFMPALLSVVAAFSVIMTATFVSQIFNGPTLNVSNDLIGQAARKSCSQNLLNAEVTITKENDITVPKIACSEYNPTEGIEELVLLISGKDNKGVEKVQVTADVKDGQVTFTSLELEKTLEDLYGLDKKQWKETKALLFSNNKGVEYHSKPCDALTDVCAEGFLGKVNERLSLPIA